MSIRNDYHIHSEISPDGKSDMEHMCQSAIEKKIQEIVLRIIMNVMHME